jgi:ribonuclease HII
MATPSLPSLYSVCSPQDNDPWHYETTLYAQGFSAIGGVDEAGRGPLAGPVIASCVVLPAERPTAFYKDSKVLSSTKREELFFYLQTTDAVIGIGKVVAREIESFNIHQASLVAMQRAVDDCKEKFNYKKIDFLLVDGKFQVPLPLPQLPLVKGESKSFSIAAASIVAKVTRDKMMADYHKAYPEYNFIKNQGYPTKEHRLALKEYGPCPLHRRTFKGVREYWQEGEQASLSEQRKMW